MIISFDEILLILLKPAPNRENPTTGYDHRIPAFTLLQFCTVFPLVPGRMLSSGLGMHQYQYLVLSIGIEYWVLSRYWRYQEYWYWLVLSIDIWYWSGIESIPINTNIRQYFNTDQYQYQQYHQYLLNANTQYQYPILCIGCNYYA